MCESWLTVPGFDFYEVSDHGRVRSLDRPVATKGGGVRLAKGRVLKPSSQGRYLVVGLYRNGEMNKRSVHRLVLEAFVGPCPTGLQGLHFDDDAANNHLSNLRWGTASQNMQDCIRNNRHPKTVTTHCARGGHAYNPENTYTNPGTGHRSCRQCLKERSQAKRTRLAARDRTHCPQLHPYDESNTYFIAGRRVCRACNLERSKEYGRRRKSRSKSV